MTADNARRSRSATIFDVARLAGVSYQTVSRVLNNQPNVRDTTKESVLRAIQQLNYVPSQAARSLVTRRSRTIGVIAVGLERHSCGLLLQRFEEAARREEYETISVSATFSGEEQMKARADVLLRQNVDAIAVLAPDIGFVETMAANEYGIPTVMVGESSMTVPYVLSSDSYRGARRAVSHLYEFGYRAIGHVGGPELSAVGAARFQGWRDQSEDLGIDPPKALFGDWSSASGYVLGIELLEDNELDAVFVANDDMAVGVLAAAHELGRKVPIDLGVVGFDDIPTAAFQRPPLTTLRQDFTGLAEDAVKMAIALAKDQEAVIPVKKRVPELVVRQSTSRRSV